MANAIERCVGSPEHFAQEVWSRSYRHFPKADPEDYADVLSLSLVDSMVTTGGMRAPTLRLVRSGEAVPRASYTFSQTTGGLRVSDAIDSRAAIRGFASGATMVLQALHRFVPSVQSFCYELEEFFGHPLQANAYLTPEGSRGLGVHHDTHDVLVLQLFGSKNWRLYPQTAPNAVNGYPESKRHPELSSPEVSLTLSPGDCLYLPRGLPHDAESTDGSSLHLTLGIRSPTWLDVVEGVMKRAGEIPDLRASLPLNYASPAEDFVPSVRSALDLTAGWLSELDEREIAASVVARQKNRTRKSRGALLQLATSESRQGNTAFKRNRPDRWTLHGDADHTLLLVDRVALRFPARIRPALEHLLSLHRVTAEALQSYLDCAGALVLLRRLHREGLLERLDE